MRVLVTGAAGLIGSGVAAFLRGSHDAVGTDLLPGTQVGPIAELSDEAAMKAALAGADAVVHVAALHAPQVGQVPDAEFRRVNVDGTARLLDLGLAAGVQRFVFTSSTSVYGHGLEPGAEAAWIDESVEPLPRDIYDATKLEAERLVRAAAAAGLPSIILRMSRCFPEPARDMAVHRLHRGIDRRDVARAHALALGAASREAPIYVISAATPFVPEDCGALLNDAAGLIRRRLPHVADRFERLGWPLPRSIGRVYSPALASAELGFCPLFNIDHVLDGDCDPPPSPHQPGSGSTHSGK
jgi:nucleoside-diphosphate-sugar epimerase